MVKKSLFRQITCFSNAPLIISGGIAWDWETGVLYWSNRGYNRIEVYDVTKKLRSVLISFSQNTRIWDIKVDPTTG